MLSVSEEEFLNLAEDLKPHMEEAMKIEVAPWIKDYVTDMDDLYTELSLEKLKDKAYGQNREELKSYKKLFPKKETPKLESNPKVPQKKAQRKKILFKGEPGIGKTTLMKKITFDWAKGMFTAVSIVFFVFLKLVNPGDAIENVIIDQTPVLEGLNITGAKVKHILEQFGPRCLLILDGLDEHALGQNEDIIRIMKGQKYLFCNVIVTSRPHSTRAIQKYFPTLVSVEGFTYSEAEKFASRILSDRLKIIQVLMFNPVSGRDRELHSVPILLSFMCLLVREDDIDLSSGASNIGEIYTRMVRCLYKKFTIRKNKEFRDDEFVRTLKLLGKLALETLLSNKPLMKREKVIREVGSDAFDYGLLIGHEDAHRLIRDETADIFVTFPHMTIWEFLGSFWFVCRLCNGDRLEDILGSDYKTPIFLTNPLFLQFCLWFLQSSDEYFTFDRKQEAYDSLISYTTQLVDEEIVNLRIIGDRFPALDERQIEAVMKYIGDVLAQCLKTKHLIMAYDFSIDSFLSYLQSNLMSLESVEFWGVHEMKRQSKYTLRKWNDFHDLYTRKCERDNELRILLDHFRKSSFQNDMIKSIINHFEYLEKRFYFIICWCDYPALALETMQLESFLDPKIHVLEVSEFDSAMLVCNNKKLPLCSKLTHLSLHIDLSKVVEGLSEALQSSKFPCLSHVSLYDRKGRSGFLPRLFRVQCPALIHLNLGSPLDEHDIDFLLTSVNVDPERSILPNLSNLMLCELRSFFERLFEKPWARITSFTLTGTRMSISSQLGVIKADRLAKVSEFSVPYREVDWISSDTASIRKLDPEKLPYLESLTLDGFIYSAEDFEGLCSKISKWELKKMDIRDSRGISGHLSALFRYPFPSLHTLVLRGCWLKSQELSTLTGAIAEGKLPKLELLDISENHTYTFELLVLLRHSLLSLKTLILRNLHLKSGDLCCLAQANAEGKLPKLELLDISENEHLKSKDLACLKHDPVSGQEVTWKCVQYSVNGFSLTL